MKVDMSSEAITRRLQRLSELRDLCMSLKLAGKQAGLQAEKDVSYANKKITSSLV